MNGTIAIATAGKGLLLKVLFAIDAIGLAASVAYDAGFWDDLHKFSGTLVNFATFASIMVSIYLKLKNKNRSPKQ